MSNSPGVSTSVWPPSVARRASGLMRRSAMTISFNGALLPSACAVPAAAARRVMACRRARSWRVELPFGR